MAYTAVYSVTGTRDERMDKFCEVIDGQPDGHRIRQQVLAAIPPRENRFQHNRYIYNAADAMQPPPHQEWCIADLLTRRSLNILVGDPGSKKTLLALDLAVCTALGKPWLGRAVSQCPVLFVDEETGKPRLWARIHAALNGHAASPQTPFHYMSLPNFDLRQADDFQTLMQAAQSVNAGLIIIDALADVIRGSDENSAFALQPFLNRMRYLAEATHAAILILHHNNRSGAFRGSSVISAGVDLLLSIESAPDSPRIDLRPLKTRDASPQPFAALAHFGPASFHLSICEDAETTRAPRPSTASAILTTLAQHQSADTQSLLTHVDRVSLGTLRNAINQLKHAGLIQRADSGQQGAKARYQLTVKGLELLTPTFPPTNHDDD